MLVRVLNRLTASPLIATLAAAALFMPASAYAGEFTDLMDAADNFDDRDPATHDPFDFNLEPTFRFDYGSARISREAPCVPTGGSSSTVDENPRLVRDSGRCSEATVVNNKEMLYRQTRSTLDITLRAGLYKDLEFRATLPYVFESSRALKYADDDPSGRRIVDAANSSVDPSDDRIRRHAETVFQPGDSASQFAAGLDDFQLYRFFDLNNQYSTAQSRGGLADPTIGLHWAPWNDHRDPTKATLALGMDYTMPVAEVERFDNSAVGRGVHLLSWSVNSSKKFDWIEPYFGLKYNLPLASTNSLYGRTDSNADSQGQVLLNPPMSGMFTVGTEFIPYEDAETGARYGIDLRFSFGYTSEGRDYTALFDHMTSDNNECNNRTIDSVRPEFDGNGNLLNPDDVACAWVVRQPSNARPLPVYDVREAIESGDTSEFAFRDLATVGSYGTFAGQLGLHLQPSRYFQFKAVGGITHNQSHLITNARTGRNSNRSNDDTVALTGPDARYERNPAYNPSYDSSGARFRIEDYNIWHFAVTAALQF
ncbi:hypothetical protein EA187_09550 [Lujinxingia sediminis]|uniref:Uncharacterized protein n=1 Tax=Lujinxingia sediminis TaxID=2480984 RepID=A0ABY0CTY5_9DELT|nr:hypothetical protein [Lujinxingia sediminis]RVU44775.1 hypothetical protein EA187_09550 [Lujinxingia sediminis]